MKNVLHNYGHAFIIGGVVMFRMNYNNDHAVAISETILIDLIKISCFCRIVLTSAWFHHSHVYLEESILPKEEVLSCLEINEFGTFHAVTVGCTLMPADKKHSIN